MLVPTIFFVCIIKLALSDTDHDERSQTELYQHPTENFRCIKCPTGKYVTEPCTEALGKSTCQSCGINGYVRDGGATSCAKCTVCSQTDKKFVWRNCSKDQDTMCYCGPNETFQMGHYCHKCHPPKVIYRSESDLDGKCDYCKAKTFYDTEENDCKTCTKCGPIGTKQLCNSTHDSVCITTIPPTTPSHITTPRTDEGGLGDGEIAGIVIASLIVVAIIVAVYCFRDWCRDQLSKCPNLCAGKTEKVYDEEDPLNPEPVESDSKSPSSSMPNGEPLNSLRRTGSRKESKVEELTSLMSSVDEERDKEAALPAWVNPMVKLISNNLDEPGECLTGLEGTTEFLPTVQYRQIQRKHNGNVRLTTLYFIEGWVAARPRANHVEEIIEKLQDMGQVSLIEKICADENIFPNSSPRKYPTRSSSDSFYTANEDRSSSPTINSHNLPFPPSSDVEVHRTESGHNLDTINDAGSEHACDAEKSIRIKDSDKTKSHKTNTGSDRLLHESNLDMELRVDRSDRDVGNTPMNDATVFRGSAKTHPNGSTHNGSIDNGSTSGHLDSSGPSQSGGISNLLQSNGQVHSPGASGESVSRGFVDLRNGSNAATCALGETKSVVVDTSNKHFTERTPVQCADDIEQTHVKQLEQ